MDKYEYKLKLEQIEKMAAKKDFITAAKIADGIDWRKVKSVSTLTMIADIYEANERYEECYELLTMVYDRSPIGRRIVYKMAEIAIKMGNFEEAIALYKEFVKIAPHDLNRYILKYQIYRERGSSVTDQITVLEEFKSHEYDEKWAYELACRYEEAGMLNECIEECDELILWFSEGEYVLKAMELKMKYQELTATQQEKYEHRFDYLEAEEFPEVEEASLEEFDEAEEIEEMEDAEAYAEVAAEIEKKTTEDIAETEETNAEVQEDTPTISEINLNKFSTINLQKELAKNLEEILAQEEPEAAAEEEETEETEAVEDPVQEQTEEGDTQEFVPFKTVLVEEVSEKQEVLTKEEISEEEVSLEEETQPEEVEITEAPSEADEFQTEILKYVAVPQKTKMDELLRTEEDGQMSLVIEEENGLEKQITGQMTIEEILEAWEEKKRQIREQIEAVAARKPAVLFETGEITGLLEDFIPKTPKEIVEAEEDAELTEPEVIEEEPETVEEPEVAEESEIIKEAELEDDLPLEIELEEALEALFEESKEEEIIEEKTVKAEKTEEKTVIGQNTASMIDAIERALALEIEPMERSGAYLTEEQEKIFAYFTSVNGMKKQLTALLEEERNYEGREDSREGNLVITGHPGNGKTTLAIDIVKAFQKQRKVKGAKLAKVSGDGFNKKDPEEVIQKLGGGALIIERAGSLKDEIVESLSRAMEGSTGGLLVILEDDSKEIERLMKKHENFAVKFNRFVDIPIFSNDELVAFGKSYAEEKEYFFDDMAVLALYDSIGVRQTAEHVVNITEVKEFIDDAIAHAEKKSRNFFVRLSKKRIDEYGNKLLLEEDFNC